jgi:hypothetical protein
MAARRRDHAVERADASSASPQSSNVWTHRSMPGASRADYLRAPSHGFAAVRAGAHQLRPQQFAQA